MDNFKQLVDIMEKLRSAEGCPWDREQTRESLKPYLLEETYELLEALDAGDPSQIMEELGDLLFQIVFHCQIGRERGEFGMEDVIAKITDKMVGRHPHVFGEARFDTSGAVARQWHERKREEGKYRESMLEGVPKALPSLLRAQRLQARAARVGFDWKRVEDVFEKLREELREFDEAVESGERGRMEDELGDILFSLVNISRFLRINSEEALRKTNEKFMRRFRMIERKAAESGRSLSAMSLDEMDALWDEAKRSEGGA